MRITAGLFIAALALWAFAPLAHLLPNAGADLGACASFGDTSLSGRDARVQRAHAGAALEHILVAEGALVQVADQLAEAKQDWKMTRAYPRPLGVGEAVSDETLGIVAALRSCLAETEQRLRDLS